MNWILENVRADELLEEIKTKVIKDLDPHDRLFVEITLEN